MIPEDAAHPHHPDERAGLFSAHDSGSIEVENGELLTALVRAWKPERVLETGTYKGIGTRCLAEGCRGNGFGRVVTLERVPRYADLARAALAELPVDVVCADSVPWLEAYDGPPFQFAFLDSGLEERVAELRLLRDRRLLHGIAFVHDTSRLRAAGGMRDFPEYPALLDELGMGGIECPWSRGWRMFQLRPEG